MSETTLSANKGGLKTTLTADKTTIGVFRNFGDPGNLYIGNLLQ